jgi:phage tail-like protein
MATSRIGPYPAYNYLVNVNGRDPTAALGGFSEVAGLKTEVHIAEYRDGNDVLAHVHKYPGMHTVGDVTLKRGLVDTSDLWEWMSQARINDPKGRRDVTITLRDEVNTPVQVYKLYAAIPKSLTGPPLNGKGTGDLAIEELVLAVEGFEISQPTS